MQHKIKHISEELAVLIQVKEMAIVDLIRDIPPVIVILEEGFHKLKQIVASHEFPSSLEEICFFKETPGFAERSLNRDARLKFSLCLEIKSRINKDSFPGYRRSPLPNC